jgi:c-di-GMP-binding flagellar brake protein YcgR
MTNEIETITELANRRQFFRIEDKAAVEISARNPDQSAAECFELSPEFGLISEFQLLDVESKHLLRTLTDKDKNLGQFLKVMNKKLDSLSRVLALNKHQISGDSVQEVNLSEGGLALKSNREYSKGQTVAIKLTLLPSYSGLILEGEVLSCRNDNAPYEIHIAFTNISEAHQQLIARHIMRIQTQNRGEKPTI